MANTEVIELEYYPVWVKQPTEPDEKFLIFERYFLPLPKANLTGAYRRYLEDQGEEGRKIDDANGQWKRDCDQFRWRERHRAYWLKKTQEDREWREEKIRQHHSQNLDTAALLRDRAQEILQNFAIEDASPKDACQMLRLASKLTESGLDLMPIDKAVAACIRWGFEVSSPDEAQSTPYGLGGVSEASSEG